jgi:CDP-diacylglycerol--glycerol-3-phosphate 3-phosphatidyltransferase
MLSGVAPWMAVVIIARELLITSLRGLCESRNVDFAAAQAGKIKMVVQSVSVPVILLLIWIATGRPDLAPGDPLLITAFWVALGTTVITAVSAWPYLNKGFRALRLQEPTP